jgi:hypothetical protein
VSAENGAKVSISGTKMLGSGIIGVFVQSNLATTSTAVVSDSIISGGSYGVVAYATIAGGNSRIFVTRCTIEATGNAVESNASVGSALITVSGSMITNNTLAWSQLGTTSAIKSLGNNHVQDNASTLSGVLTPASLQ